MGQSNPPRNPTQPNHLPCPSKRQSVTHHASGIITKEIPNLASLFYTLRVL